ncbi:hypothetical protein BJX65DRAFT_272473 [Aspergillus insuetus]
MGRVGIHSSQGTGPLMGVQSEPSRPQGLRRLNWRNIRQKKFSGGNTFVIPLLVEIKGNSFSQCLDSKRTCCITNPLQAPQRTGISRGYTFQTLMIGFLKIFRQVIQC